MTNYKEIVLAHGSGGKLSQELMQKIILPQFRNDLLEPLHDGAAHFGQGRHPPRLQHRFLCRQPDLFPGGDIGKLTVHGTVNDLAMCGARPLHLSVGFILEEGLPMDDFWRVVKSMWQAADAAGRDVGDRATMKVVDRGKADKIVHQHVGDRRGAERREHRSCCAPGPGDKIILSGAIAVHGIAIMSVREGLEFETEIASDTAPPERSGGKRFSPRKQMFMCCATATARRVHQRPERKSLAERGVGHAARRSPHSHQRGSQGRLRDSRARPALRRQRREVAWPSSLPTPLTSFSPPCKRIRWARDRGDHRRSHLRPSQAL